MPLLAAAAATDNDTVSSAVIAMVTQTVRSAIADVSGPSLFSSLTRLRSR